MGARHSVHCPPITVDQVARLQDLRIVGLVRFDQRNNHLAGRPPRVLAHTEVLHVEQDDELTGARPVRPALLEANAHVHLQIANGGAHVVVARHGVQLPVYVEAGKRNDDDCGEVFGNW